MKKTKAKLDRIFSEYIRLRDSDKNGYGGCISCGKVVHWKDADAGHYINRRHMNTRYDEMNVNLQCRSCNSFDEGNAPGYTKGIIKKYGPEILDMLLAKKMMSKKIDKFELETFIDYYKEEVKQLKKEKE